MPSNVIIDADLNRDDPLTFTKDDIYNHCNDSNLLLIIQRRLRKCEKQFDRLIALLQVKLSDPIDIKRNND
jgi:hypothetical protein